jgi:EAL domain-containing protein (putative c-di-GMP-specific phosphodiesterase class I)
LKIPIIAEGVETDAQLRLLRDMGCGMVQGFYFSRPSPPQILRQTSC